MLERRHSSTFLGLLGFAAPLWPWIALSVLLGTATIGSGVALLATSAWIIATAALQPSIAVLQVAIVGVRFFGITRGLFRYLERLVSHQVTFRLLATLRVWFYARLEPLAPAVLQRFRSGDLLARAVSDIGTLENFYVRVIAPPLIAVLTALGMGLFFAAYDRALAVAVLAFLAAAGAGVPLLTLLLGRVPGRALIAERARLNAALVDSIQGLPDAVAYGHAPAQLAQVEAIGRSLGNAQRRMAAIRGLHSALVNVLTGLAVLAALILAIPLVRAARLSGVDLAVIALAAAACFEAVVPLPQAAQYLEACLAAAERLRVGDQGIGDREQGTGSREQGAGNGEWGVSIERSTPTPCSLSPIPSSLSVRDLRFRYAPGEPPALDGLSFDVGPGEILALVGPSGAGKSTLVNLLLRFWDYQEGEVRLAGQDLRSYPGEEVRRRIGVVAQSTHLFNATVRDNLLLARPDATQADLEQAARAAEIHDFISRLPEGYDTWIGESGLRLSGGERQRLAIARALLKDAPILILDEATANLDPLTERAILQAVRTLVRGRTTLMITHRLAGLEIANEILVLQAGRLVERGSHTALLAAEGLYRRMWEYQAQDAAVEALSGATILA